jgi:3-hydroxyacyl-[acyl-carrier-protein] dehydratase
MSEETVLTDIDIFEVLECLPHRYPFLLVDKVISCDPGKRLTAVKNVTINEPFFQGHFPERPVMPGVLLLEALAQATGVLGILTMKEAPSDESMYFFVGIDNARFKKPVVPGDQVQLDVELLKVRRNIWVFHGEASVDQKVVAVADLMCTYRSVGEIRN